MAEPHWADEALRYAAGLTQKRLVRDRGVFDSDTSGVSVVFSPVSEMERIDGALSDARYEVLALSSHLGGEGYTIVWLVRSDETDSLDAIVVGNG
jgi:hypothetical protein